MQHYYITITGGCSGTKNCPAVINCPHPMLPLHRLQELPRFCIGATATYTANGVILEAEQEPGAAVILRLPQFNAVTGVVTAVGAGTCNIIYTITGGCGGPASAQQSLTVTPNAAVASVTGILRFVLEQRQPTRQMALFLGGGTGAWRQQ